MYKYLQFVIMVIYQDQKQLCYYSTTGTKYISFRYCPCKMYVKFSHDGLVNLKHFRNTDFGRKPCVFSFTLPLSVRKWRQTGGGNWNRHTTITNVCVFFCDLYCVQLHVLVVILQKLRPLFKRHFIVSDVLYCVFCCSWFDLRCFSVLYISEVSFLACSNADALFRV